MLDSPTHNQKQLWVAQRLHRICSCFRSKAASEPCLEQYEQEVQMVLDEQVTPAASAWIEIIVQTLRQGVSFRPEEYIRS